MTALLDCKPARLDSIRAEPDETNARPEAAGIAHARRPVELAMTSQPIFEWPGVDFFLRYFLILLPAARARGGISFTDLG